MPTQNSFFRYSSDGVTFVSKDATLFRQIYLPLSGTTSAGLKSCITPYLSGDIKIDKHTYLTKPASREDLRYNVREFFLNIEGAVYSIAQESEVDSAEVEIGQLYHKLTRRHPEAGIEMEALNFVPVSGEHVEIMKVTVRNASKKTIKFTPTFALPVFGRSLANKHDHEHVTALLHRTKQTANGVLIEPTMNFNEEGHKTYHTVYFVYGQEAGGSKPAGTFPTVETFYGEEGNLSQPKAVIENLKPKKLSDEELQGKEVVGALRFKETTLQKGEAKEYILVFGVADSEANAAKAFDKFKNLKSIESALADCKKFWQKKTHSIEFKSGDAQFDSWMKWVALQPVLRRIWGCSFLPDHDYGKGGKGWRDLWQDLLSLILIEPELIRENLINNFMGVRIDGSNATIIGTHPGEFIADRNAITRVWMDHGVWCLLTTLLYIHQTGDTDILFKDISYFKDPQQSRTFEKDANWTPQYGNRLKTRGGQVYLGTILEHILVQHLVQFFNVGEHNIIRLESADWNDGLDMAFKRGESAAFMAIYGGNLLTLADLLEDLSRIKKVQHLRIAMEVMILLDTLTEEKCNYDKLEEKKKLLFQTYFKSVQPEVSGEHLDVKVSDIVSDLRKKSEWIFEKLRRDEYISIKDGKEHHSWFNGYYDNKGLRVEGKVHDRVQMTLTGQVFPIMSGVAEPKQIQEVVKSANKYLKDKQLGGYRLNTDFGVKHYLDLGRAFGFAYGTKENGAFFSHMNVMYGYGLYKRGFVKEGYDVLSSIYKMSHDTKRAKIYPGIPEYFDSEGRGMYHYLTGSASWMVLTELTQVFGVRGEYGDLILEPKLVKAQFDKKGHAQVSCQFAERKLVVIYKNAKLKEFGQYRVKEVSLNGKQINCAHTDRQIKLERSVIEKSPQQTHIEVTLS